MKNRRKEHRYRVRLAGKIFIENRVFQMESENVSVGGVRISLDRPLLEGADVNITLQLGKPENPGSPGTFTTSGTVIWCQEDILVGYQAGIRFSSQMNTARQRLATFLLAFTPG